MQDGSEVYPADFFVLGAVKRILALSAGFRGLIEARNFTCAASLLRLQIDTAARVYALREISDLNDFGLRLISGERFSHQKANNGQKLKDVYIIGELEKAYPWVKKVYEETSDFIHLSGRHFFASISSLNDQERTVNIEIGPTDPKRPETDYFEVLEAFFEATKLSGLTVQGYLAAKQSGLYRRSPEEPTP